MALSLFGTSSLNYVIHKRKLTLFGQLCRLDTFYAAKRFFLYRITSQFLFEDITCGFISDLFKLLKDYDLNYVLNDFMNSGQFITKYSWKRLVSSKLNPALIVILCPKHSVRNLKFFYQFNLKLNHHYSGNFAESIHI